MTTEFLNVVPPAVSTGPGAATTVENCRTDWRNMHRSINASTDVFQPVEVDLWGPKYSLAMPTRRVERAMDEALSGLAGLPDDASDDDTFAAICEVLNVLLIPIPDEEGKKIHAKTQLKALYKKEDGPGIGYLNALLESLMEARAERPT